MSGEANRSGSDVVTDGSGAGSGSEDRVRRWVRGGARGWGQGVVLKEVGQGAESGGWISGRSQWVESGGLHRAIKHLDHLSDENYFFLFCIISLILSRY